MLPTKKPLYERLIAEAERKQAEAQNGATLPTKTRLISERLIAEAEKKLAEARQHREASAKMAGLAKEFRAKAELKAAEVKAIEAAREARQQRQEQMASADSPSRQVQGEGDTACSPQPSPEPSRLAEEEARALLVAAEALRLAEGAEEAKRLAAEKEVELMPIATEAAERESDAQNLAAEMAEKQAQALQAAAQAEELAEEAKEAMSKGQEKETSQLTEQSTRLVEQAAEKRRDAERLDEQRQQKEEEARQLAEQCRPKMVEAQWLTHQAGRARAAAELAANEARRLITPDRRFTFEGKPLDEVTNSLEDYGIGPQSTLRRGAQGESKWNKDEWANFFRHDCNVKEANVDAYADQFAGKGASLQTLRGLGTVAKHDYSTYKRKMAETFGITDGFDQINILGAIGPKCAARPFL